MGKESGSFNNPDNQLFLFKYANTYRPNIEVISLEAEPLLRLPYNAGIAYTRHIVELGKDSVTAYKSFWTKFEVEVLEVNNLEFVNAMRTEGYTVVSNRIIPDCDVCGKDITLEASVSYSCGACGGREFHMDCEGSTFYGHWDHNCFSACCKSGHADLMYITEQDFFDTTPESITYIDEELESDHPETQNIIYTVTHSRLSFYDRQKIAHNEFVDLQNSKEMAEALKLRRNFQDMLD